MGESDFILELESSALRLGVGGVNGRALINLNWE